VASPPRSPTRSTRRTSRSDRSSSTARVRCGLRVTIRTTSGAQSPRPQAPRPRPCAGETAPNTFSEHEQMVVNQYLKIPSTTPTADRFVSGTRSSMGVPFHDREVGNSEPFGRRQVSHGPRARARGCGQPDETERGPWGATSATSGSRGDIGGIPTRSVPHARLGVSQNEDVHRFVRPGAQGQAPGRETRPTAADVRNLFRGSTSTTRRMFVL